MVFGVVTSLEIIVCAMSRRRILVNSFCQQVLTRYSEAENLHD